MTGKLAYGQPNNRVPFKGPYNGPLTFLDTQTKERKVMTPVNKQKLIKSLKQNSQPHHLGNFVFKMVLKRLFAINKLGR